MATEQLHVPVDPDPPSPFPPSPRVIYRTNTLIEVVCQVRFPVILRIDVEPPAAFQDRIREQYPVLNEKSNDILGLPANVPNVIVNMLRSSTAKHNLAYDFVSADGKWTIGLTREFLSLTTSSYRNWEEFKSHLDGPLQAFIGEYKPAWFTRVGLRYQNLIRPSTLNLTGRPWSELLRPQATGLLAATDLRATIVQAFTQAVIQFRDGAGNVHLQYGLAQAANDNETCYLIDGDFFSDQQTRPTDVYGKLNFFNQQSGRLFRWCISDALDEAMGPEPGLL